jgi:hypothetical protein
MRIKMGTLKHSYEYTIYKKDVRKDYVKIGINKL